MIAGLFPVEKSSSTAFVDELRKKVCHSSASNVLSSSKRGTLRYLHRRAEPTISLLTPAVVISVETKTT